MQYDNLSVTGDTAVFHSSHCCDSADEFDTLYTLGAISDVDHLSGGNIAVLDRLSASAYIFSPSGEYLAHAGCRGSGPGEFNSPDAIVPLSSDSMLIFDRTIRRISLYNENGTHIHDIPENCEFPVPYWSKYNGPNQYVGGIMYMNSNSEGYEIEYSICSFGNDLCPVDTFFTNKAQMKPDDITNTIQNSVFSCAFTCDSEGNVFVAPAGNINFRSSYLDQMGNSWLQWNSRWQNFISE